MNCPFKSENMKRNNIFYTSFLIIGSVGFSTMAAHSADYDAHARQIVAQMTLDEKIAQLHGIRDANNYRIVPALPRLGIPALPLCNGPAGVGPAGPGHEGKATALSAPISLAATWDTNAARIYGEICGSESASLGNVLIEAPDVNITRTPHGGRTFEAFGEDPYLVSQMAVAEIEGIQSQGILANVKHYAANNQEANRTEVDEIIDERTLHEIYLLAFEASVKEGHVASLMAAYNKVNGVHCCESAELLDQILKKDWNFKGFVTSDFGAVRSTIPSALAGLDLEMATGKYFGTSLEAAVKSGQVPMSVIDDKLIRRFRTMMEFGLFDHVIKLQAIPARKDGIEARHLAEEGMVLLKNAGNQLPLVPNGLNSIAVIGPFAGQAMTGGGGSSHVEPLYTVAPVDGIRHRVGSKVKVTFADGKDVAEAAALAKSCDAAIVMVGDKDTEGRDHSLTLNENQDALVEAIAAANPHTVVVLKTGSAVFMPWLDKVPAILEAWYPGEEDGNAVAAVLFGDVNPSGKLPITFPKNLADLPVHTLAQYPGIHSRAHYSEGVLVGYRWYDDKKIEPLFPFGYGLSYTTFHFERLNVSATGADKSVTVQFTVTNTGKRDGAEVAQVYISLPSLRQVLQPPRQLKGFQRVELAPGQSMPVTFHLDARSLSYWDKAADGWEVAPGVYTVSVGDSSRNLRLRGTFSINP